MDSFFSLTIALTFFYIDVFNWYFYTWLSEDVFPLRLALIILKK